MDHASLRGLRISPPCDAMPELIAILPPRLHTYDDSEPSDDSKSNTSYPSSDYIKNSIISFENEFIIDCMFLDDQHVIAITNDGDKGMFHSISKRKVNIHMICANISKEIVWSTVLLSKDLYDIPSSSLHIMGNKIIACVEKIGIFVVNPKTGDHQLIDSKVCKLAMPERMQVIDNNIVLCYENAQITPLFNYSLAIIDLKGNILYSIANSTSNVIDTYVKRDRPRDKLYYSIGKDVYEWSYKEDKIVPVANISHYEYEFDIKCIWNDVIYTSTICFSEHSHANNDSLGYKINNMKIISENLAVISKDGCLFLFDMKTNKILSVIDNIKKYRDICTYDNMVMVKGWHDEPIMIYKPKEMTKAIK